MRSQEEEEDEPGGARRKRSQEGAIALNQGVQFSIYCTRYI